jgi:hypothetical protein
MLRSEWRFLFYAGTVASKAHVSQFSEADVAVFGKAGSCYNVAVAWCGSSESLSRWSERVIGPATPQDDSMKAHDLFG